MPAKRKSTSPSRPPGRVEKEEFSFGLGESSLGSVLVASSEQGIVAILIGQDADRLPDELQQRFPKARLVQEDEGWKDLVARVVRHIERPSRRLDVTLDIRGTPFQQRVWDLVRKIPAGQTSTYTEIAQKISKPKAMRAVGNACSLNNLSFAIPCHRVTRNDGSFRGRRDFDAERQRILLERETGT